MNRDDRHFWTGLALLALLKARHARRDRHHLRWRVENLERAYAAHLVLHEQGYR